MRLGALEAGGTKMVCAIGDENGNILLAETDEDKIIQCLKDNGFNGSTK